MRVEIGLSNTLAAPADREGEVLEGGSARQGLVQVVYPDDKETDHGRTPATLCCVLAWSSMQNTWAETMVPARRSSVEEQ